MLKSFDEMTPDQRLAYKMGYEAARSELRVAGPNDLLIRRGDMDAAIERAAKTIHEIRDPLGDVPMDKFCKVLAAGALSVLLPGEEEE